MKFDKVLWNLDAFAKNFRQLSENECMGDSSIFCGLKEIFTQFELSDESSLSPSVMRVALANAFEQKQGRERAEGRKRVGKREGGLDLDICPRAPEVLVTPLSQSLYHAVRSRQMVLMTRIVFGGHGANWLMAPDACGPPRQT